MSEDVSITREHATCPACGYDLFGLTVDQNVVRCPECGLRFDLRLLRIPPVERARKLRGMETLPAFAVGPVAGVILVLWLAIDTRDAIPENWAIIIVCATLALLGIAAGAIFLHRYRYVVGARHVLLLFGVCSVLFLVGAPMFLCGLPAAGSLSSRGIHLAMAVPVFGAAALVWFWVLYRRARRILGSMHDQLVGRVVEGGSDAETGKPDS